MGCPRCGGTERRVISPSYFECDTVSYEQVLDASGVPMGERPTVCGHRYREGAPPSAGSPTCQVCGTYSIGVCQECSKDVCGDHGQLAQDQLVCRAHVEAWAQDAATAKELQRREAHERAAALWDIPSNYEDLVAIQVGRDMGSRDALVFLRRAVKVARSEGLSPQCDVLDGSAVRTSRDPRKAIKARFVRFSNRRPVWQVWYASPRTSDRAVYYFDEARGVVHAGSTHGDGIGRAVLFQHSSSELVAVPTGCEPKRLNARGLFDGCVSLYPESTLPSRTNDDSGYGKEPGMYLLLDHLFAGELSAPSSHR